MTGLGNRFASLSLEEKRHERKLIVIQEFEKLPTGPFLSLECNNGDDFLSEAERLVREKFAIPVADAVFFCCYVAGGDSRFEFSQSGGYWNVTPVSCIYFWSGPRPNSPEKDRQMMRERLVEVERELCYLRATSSSAQEKESRWQQGGVVQVEDMPRVTSSCLVDMASVQTELNAQRSPMEPGVQELWVALTALIPVQGFFLDCTNPNGLSFSGRSHDIDLVLMSRNIRGMEHVDTPIELKQQITSHTGRRDVTLQLLDRIKFVFDAQPTRQVCWGVGLDAKNVLFVRCYRSFEYGVTATCSLWGKDGMAQALFDFLGAPAITRGFVPVVLPELWGQVVEGLLSSSDHACVFRLANGRAAKVGSQVTILAEWGIIEHLHNVSEPGLIIPHCLVTTELATANALWPCGFQMELHKVVSVSKEGELCSLVGDVFWKLGVLHSLGVVHNDVKPSNLLQTAGGEHLLCDFGNALYWKEGDPMASQRGATECFKVVTGAFAASETSMFACDMEGLFWTALSLWLKVIGRRDSTPHLGAVERLDRMVLLGSEGGVRLNKNVQLISPQAPLLMSYFQQARERTLKEPLKLFHKFRDELGADVGKVEWMTAAVQFIATEGIFPCPDKILVWVWDHVVCTAKNEQVERGN